MHTVILRACHINGLPAKRSRYSTRNTVHYDDGTSVLLVQDMIKSCDRLRDRDDGANGERQVAAGKKSRKRFKGTGIGLEDRPTVFRATAGREGAALSDLTNRANKP